MKLSPKYMLPLLAAISAIAIVSPAFAWSHSICNPTTGEVLRGNGAAPLTTEALYYAYLHDHPGSFEMSAGQACTKTVTPPVAPTVPVTQPAPANSVGPVTPASAVTPITPPAPVVVRDNRPWLCHAESTVGFATPRRSNDLLKDLAKPGNTAIGTNGVCAKPVAPVVALASLPIATVAGIQVEVTPPSMPVAPPSAPGSVTPVEMPTPVTPPPVSASVTPVEMPTPVSDAIISPPGPSEPVVFAPPAAGDGTGADELVP